MILCIGALVTPASATVLDGSTPGLRAYWLTNASGVSELGHVDWASYDHLSQVDNIDYTNNADAFYTDGPTSNFAVRFMGQIDIPADGIWTMSTGSDDGSILFIDGQPLIENDGLHSYRTRSNIIGLTEGLHDFEVWYFQGPGHSGLSVMWDGPGMDAAEVIPASAFTSPAEAPTFDTGGEGLWAYWYNNARHAANVGQIDWTNPDKVTTISRIHFASTRGSFFPDGPTDRFAARFVGVIAVPSSGLWTFSLGSDDGSALYIDGELVVNDPNAHGFRWRSGTALLTEGDHTIEVRFWERTSNAALSVAWTAPGSSFSQIIPSSAYRPGDGAVNPDSGGGLYAYRYDSARHASNVGQVDWADYDSMDTVQNIYYPLTSGSFSTGGPTDYFAMRFVGKIEIPTTGSWIIGLGSDQSGRVLIDGVPLIDDAAGHSFRWRYGTKTLAAGFHDIEVQYWDGWSQAGLVLTWRGPDDEFEQVVPASAFSPSEQEEVLGVGGDGLRVYWIDSARHASRVGHLDWQNYDRMTFESNISWGLTGGVFEGTTITNDSGESTSQGGVSSDYFGLRAEGLIQIPTDGLWGFGLGSDQSAQLFIDGELVINDDTGHSYRWRNGQIELEAGLHAFEVRYWEGWSSAGLIATWTPPGDVETVIPPAVFSHSVVETPYDSGGGGLRAYWNTNARHASNVGQIDFATHDHTTNVPNIAWPITSGAFDDETPSDYFGVRLLGQIDVPSSGTWTFSLGSDQSAALLIDGEPVIVDSTSHSYRWQSGTIELSSGKHDIDVRYWDGWSSAGLNLAWKGPSVPAEIIVPRSAYSLQPTESPFETGGGLRAYITSNARHASNAGQIDYAEHSSSEIVENVSWRVTSTPFFVDGPTDYYGLRLISELTVPESGTWTFNMGSDQSAILLIDDEPVIVDTTSHSYRWRGGTVDLTQGVHKFEVRYWEGWSQAGLNVTWKGPSSSLEEIIPASAFHVYDPEPVFDAGEAAITVQWFDQMRGYSLDSLDDLEASKTTIEPRISWNVTSGSFISDVPSDYFAFKATAKLSVPRTGEWSFGVGSDQYALLYINGESVVSDSSSHSYRWRNGTITLEAGEHDLELRYMDGWSSAGAFLTWRGPGDLYEEVIPASAFVSAPDRVRVVRWREIGAEHNR